MSSNTMIIYYNLNMLNSHLKKKLTIAYVIGLVFLAVFIRYSLNQDPIKVTEKESEQRVEVKPVEVTLKIQETGLNLQERIRMTNQDTILDFLEKLREEERITFEKTAYTHGTKLDHINNVYPNENQRWAVFLESNPSKEITYKIGDVKLQDKEIYTLKLIRSEETQ